MKPNLVFVALVLSLLFNVFFIAGYARARQAAARDVTDVVGRELDLDDQRGKEPLQPRAKMDQSKWCFLIKMMKNRFIKRFELLRPA